ncbi:MAG: translation initiation factor IF-6 [Thermoplasmata archaeon]|mgnify:CR=1 FL=1|nr:MAG: translation initiation factor IF-6 [Thermoplasmata archaeon]
MNGRSRFQRLAFDENPNVGVFGRANDEYIFIREGLSKNVRRKIIEALDVRFIELRIADANIIGSLLAFNKNGMVVTDLVSDETLNFLQDQGLNVCVINDKYNAVGNDILVNDNGALVHPDFHDDAVRLISETLKVPVYRGTIASLKTVGMAAVVTNKGLLCHPKVDDEEKKILEKIFQVPVMIGTVNHGVPLIGSGLIANTKGAVAGSLTTGIEMGRIEEALHLNE